MFGSKGTNYLISTHHIDIKVILRFNISSSSYRPSGGKLKTSIRWYPNKTLNIERFLHSFIGPHLSSSVQSLDWLPHQTSSKADGVVQGC